ncbi:MAG: hypothetical protein K5831_12720 [Brevundimonas sp.]|uniref:hypothetical protein n=1 Tax=Brevundimonas sp. TaxID=1871086 RepID=UPI002590900E|nr:hypothetical protein [Brevundimonas sp.]MCV0415726.1 hypothetical protein [Brevundimonas sp.]
MTEALLKQLVEAVEAHYAADGAPPLLASRFGHHNKGLLNDLKGAYGGLLAAVKAAGEERLRIVDERHGREVIAPANRAADVGVEVQQQSATAEAAASSFDSLPKSVQIAFCVRTEAGEQVTLRVTPPFDYKRVKAGDLVRPGFRPVQDEFRKPGLALGSATLQDKQTLWQNLLAWARQEQLDPATFRPNRRDGNALARFLAVQPSDIIDRIVIPADIAEILLRRS